MIDLKQAEQQNQWLAAHWHDGVPLPLLDIDLGDALKYNVHDVLTHLWLRHATEAARAAKAKQPEPAPDPRVMTVVNAAQTLGEITGLSADEIIRAVEAARVAKAAAGEPILGEGSQPDAAAPQEAATGLADAAPERSDNSTQEAR